MWHRGPGPWGSGGATYFKSILQMWVSRDLPEPQGSIRYWESITTARTPPMSWASSCSTERDTRVHMPLGRSVFQVLRRNKPCKSVMAKGERKTWTQSRGHIYTFLSKSRAQIPMPGTWVRLMVSINVWKFIQYISKQGLKRSDSEARNSLTAFRSAFGTPDWGPVLLCSGSSCSLLKRWLYSLGISTHSLNSSIFPRAHSCARLRTTKIWRYPVEEEKNSTKNSKIIGVK